LRSLLQSKDKKSALSAILLGTSLTVLVVLIYLRLREPL
jgi:hypothetical protein